MLDGPIHSPESEPNRRDKELEWFNDSPLTKEICRLVQAFKDKEINIDQFETGLDGIRPRQWFPSFKQEDLQARSRFLQFILHPDGSGQRSKVSNLEQVFLDLSGADEQRILTIISGKISTKYSERLDFNRIAAVSTSARNEIRKIINAIDPLSKQELSTQEIMLSMGKIRSRIVDLEIKHSMSMRDEATQLAYQYLLFKFNEIFDCYREGEGRVSFFKRKGFSQDLMATTNDVARNFDLPKRRQIDLAIKFAKAKGVIELVLSEQLEMQKETDEGRKSVTA